ncbi:MAG: hypothetical protein ACOH2E_06800 [Candidatus Paracaedibacter sp.]
MKNKNLYSLISVMTSSLLLCCTIHGGDRSRAVLSKTDQDIINNAEAAHEGAGKRVQKRAEARDLQKKGEDFGKNVKTATKPLSYSGNVVGLAASASGDPHAKMVAAAFKLSVMAVEELGDGISKIIMGIGRYQERSQAVLSNAEVLLEEIQKSLDKKRVLAKNLEQLLSVEKPLEPSQSSSRLKQLGRSAASTVKTAEIKVRQATDVLTNDKAARDEKRKAIQDDLKVENDNYQENIRLLQILLMQDTLGEIEKMIDINGTIATLLFNRTFFQDARKNISKSRSKQKKQIAKIEKDDAANNKNLIYYLQFQKSPTTMPQELQKDKTELLNKIKELTQLTKRGETLYLQKKEVELDSEVNRIVIVGLYREIDAIKSQLEALGKTTPTKTVTDPELLKKEAGSQGKPVPGIALPRTGLSEEVIRNQRPILRPPQGVAQRLPQRQPSGG